MIKARVPRALLFALVLAVPAGAGHSLVSSRGLDPDARLEADAQAVVRARAGLLAAVEFAAGLTAGEAERPSLPSAPEREALRVAWRSFLDYILALDVIGREHRDARRLPAARQNASFAILHAAFLAQYRGALDWIVAVERDPALPVVLDERQDAVGLPAGSYTRMKTRFLNVVRGAEHAALATVAARRATDRFPRMREDAQWDAAAIWRAGAGRGEAMTLRNALHLLDRASFAVFFPIQQGVASWMGDTKVRRRDRTLITEEQAAALAPRLRPGDILLERREWYLSNVGLPGYWPHAALYLGTAEERSRFLAGAEIADWVRAQGEASGEIERLLTARAPAGALVASLPDGPPRILEAMSEGVVFTSIEHSAAADSLAVLRPRLTPVEVAAALLRALGFAGRPYDFDFDFRTDAALVCTELVYKAYEPRPGFRGLRLPLVEVLGRTTLPANEIVRDFDATFGGDGQQLDLVLFLDGDERAGAARESDLAAFRSSWTRPKWHIMLDERR